MTENQQRPLVSLLVFTYNQSAYVEEALKGAFAQTYSPLEIIISDDFSTDETFSIIQRMTENYKGQHHLVILRNSTNLGLINHVNKVILMAKGELMVLAAGDDVSLPERCNVLVREYINNGEPMLLHSKAFEIDLNGRLTGEEAPHKKLHKKMSLEEAAISSSIYLGASGAWSREIVNKYGTISHSNAYEDLVMGFRAILENKIYYVDQCLLLYRIGNGISNSNYVDKIENRKRIIRVMIDVLSQRMEDFSISSVKSSHAIESIENQLFKYHFLQSFYNAGNNIPHYFLIKPMASFGYFFSEIKFLVKVKFPKILLIKRNLIKSFTTLVSKLRRPQ